MTEQPDDLTKVIRELQETNQALTKEVRTIRQSVEDGHKRQDRFRRLFTFFSILFVFTVSALACAWQGVHVLVGPASDNEGMDTFDAVLLMAPLALLIVWSMVIGLCYFMIWRGRVRLRSLESAEAPETERASPPEQMPQEVDRCCSICRTNILLRGDEIHPLDPCGLVLVAHCSKSRAEQKELFAYCHFECFRKVTGDYCLALMHPEALTVGEFGHGLLEDLPPKPTHR